MLLSRLCCCQHRRSVKRTYLHYHGIPRDVTRTDVIAEDEDEQAGVTSDVSVTGEWRLGELWIDDESDVCQVEPFIDRRPAPHTAAAEADEDDDDDDDDDYVERRRRRSRPDLVPRRLSFLTPPTDQELNKTCDDVTVLRRLTSPVHCHCLPVAQSDVIT